MTKPTLTPTAIPVAEEGCDTSGTGGFGVVVLTTGLVLFWDSVSMITIEGSLKVKGSVHTWKAAFKLNGSAVISLQGRQVRSWGPIDAIKDYLHGKQFPDW